MTIKRLQKGKYWLTIKGHNISLVDISDTLENPNARGVLKWSLWCTTIDLEQLMYGDLLYPTKREAIEMIQYYFNKLDT
jgi:hypothetical protein